MIETLSIISSLVCGLCLGIVHYDLRRRRLEEMERETFKKKLEDDLKSFVATHNKLVQQMVETNDRLTSIEMKSMSKPVK